MCNIGGPLLLDRQSVIDERRKEEARQRSSQTANEWWTKKIAGDPSINETREDKSKAATYVEVCTVQMKPE